MNHSPVPADALLDSALGAISSGAGYRAVLDALPVPVYLTDADGLVTYWNQACVAFAGREPQLGRDRWCVTWQLYTLAGEPLAHEECPMATAIRGRRSVRNEIAIAERPDGTRRAFTPYPTPLFDSAGRFTGAVNMLVDVSDEQVEVLTEQAKRCRRLASYTNDRDATEVLDHMALDYERTAASLRQACPGLPSSD
ncbi:MAG TPA: PAS domain-containing protein [Sphingomicrobium sp.]|nr:PAS domain-containing protein [Sphingomicrobium sp.]